MDEAMRNAVGRIFARECDVLELYRFALFPWTRPTLIPGFRS